MTSSLQYSYTYLVIFDVLSVCQVLFHCFMREACIRLLVWWYKCIPVRARLSKLSVEKTERPDQIWFRMHRVPPLLHAPSKHYRALQWFITSTEKTPASNVCFDTLPATRPINQHWCVSRNTSNRPWRVVYLNVADILWSTMPSININVNPSLRNIYTSVK